MDYYSLKEESLEDAKKFAVMIEFAGQLVGQSNLPNNGIEFSSTTFCILGCFHPSYLDIHQPPLKSK